PPRASAAERTSQPTRFPHESRSRTRRRPTPVRFGLAPRTGSRGRPVPHPGVPMPPARKPDQSAPTTVSPTGVGYGGPKDGRDPRAQAGDRLTTPNGGRTPDRA